MVAHPTKGIHYLGVAAQPAKGTVPGYRSSSFQYIAELVLAKNSKAKVEETFFFILMSVCRK
jgi:hypothetical protein